MIQGSQRIQYTMEEPGSGSEVYAEVADPNKLTNDTADTNPVAPSPMFNNTTT